MEDGIKSLPQPIRFLGTSTVFLQRAPIATSSYGVLNIGGGVFDGVSAARFIGSASGTALAINVPSGFGGNLLDLQVGGTNKITAGATASTVALSVRGSASQSTDLQRWQASNGTVLSRINANGDFIGDVGAVYTGTIGDIFQTGPYLSLGNAVPITLNTRAATNVGLVVKGFTSQSVDLQQWQDSTGTVMGMISNAGRCRFPFFTDPTNTGAYLAMSTGSMTATPRSSNMCPLICQGLSGQSVDLQRWQDNSANNLAKVDATGNMFANALTPTSGARITSGSGAPSTPGGANPTAGDLYVRTDTPSTANQRLYSCTVGGASPTWVGIV
jgi:hypothetical protein